MEILMQEERIIALLHGPDRAGIVARVSGWIYARGGNILHADQHRDRQEGIFFQRVEWIPVGDIDEEIRLFEELAHNRNEVVQKAENRADGLQIRALF